MRTLWTLLVFGGLAGPAASAGAAEEEASPPRSIAFLVIDGVFNTELVTPMDVLQHVVGRVDPLRPEGGGPLRLR